MTNKQKKEIECLKWFMRPKIMYDDSTSAYKANIKKMLGIESEIIETPDGVSPEEAYTAITSTGQAEVRTTDKAATLQLLDAQKWRLRMMSEYEQGILAGCFLGWYTIMGFEGRRKGIWNGIVRWWKKQKGYQLKERTPECVVEFMARTMFKGIDKDEMNFYNREKLKHI